MMARFDKPRTIAGPISRPIRSPALVPGPNEAEGETALVVGLVNNMPDSALNATERQFMRLLQTAAGKTPGERPVGIVHPPIGRTALLGDRDEVAVARDQRQRADRGVDLSMDVAHHLLLAVPVFGRQP